MYVCIYMYIYMYMYICSYAGAAYNAQTHGRIVSLSVYWCIYTTFLHTCINTDRHISTQVLHMVHRHMAAYQLFYMNSMLIQKVRGGHELCHIHISLYACACIYEYQTWMSHKYGHEIHNGAVGVSHLDVICGWVIYGAQVPHVARERARERGRESARERQGETTREQASERESEM